MMNKKKIFMIGGIAVVVLSVSLVFLNDNMYSSVSVGHSQYSDMPFDMQIEFSDFVVVGTVVDKETVLLQYDVMDIDEDGVDYVVTTSREPFEKITLRVDDYLRDVTGDLDSMLVVYEMYVDGLGWKDGVRTMFYKPNSQTYEIGDHNLYVISAESDHPNKFIIHGFYSEFYFQNINGTKHIQSQANHFFDNPPIAYSDAVDLVDSINNRTMTSDMIQKHKDYKP